MKCCLESWIRFAYLMIETFLPSVSITCMFILQEWSETMKDVDKNLVEDAHQNGNNADYPPIRQQKREDQPESQPTVS